MIQSIRTIGIIGVGKLGIVLSQLATKAGFEVGISGSGDPEKIRLTVDVLSPGAKAMRSEEAIRASDVVILALPLGKFRQIPSAALSGKIVIDAMNYWWEVDGPRDGIVPDGQSSSEAVQEFFPEARVVKALSHLSYHDLYDGAQANVDADKKAVAVASDDEEALQVAMRIIERLGFTTLSIGSLAQGVQLEPGSPAFGASVSLGALRDILGDNVSGSSVS